MSSQRSSAELTTGHDSLALDPAIVQAFVIDACGGDLDLVLQMVEFFVNSATKLVAEMRDGLAGGEMEQLRRAAHSLKSSSRMFSANHLSDLSAEVESRAKAGQTDGVDPLVGQVQEELERVAQALPAFCRGILA